MFDQIAKTIESAKRIVVIQADNPDADSLCSALALEQLLGEQGEQVSLYCGINIPDYLHHVSGWDRVLDALPSQFDLSIIVDTSTLSLLSKLQNSPNYPKLTKTPCLVLDHHAETDDSIHFASLTYNQPQASSTGELIYQIARELRWKLDEDSGEYIMTAILGDTQGLTNENTSADTYRVMAELVELNVSRPKLEELRRAGNKMDERIFRYKATLISRSELHAGGALAYVDIPQEEINRFSPLYNPAPLIQGDMLQTSGVQMALVVKYYDSGRILGSIRCNFAAPIAAELAAHFGGGGHPHAAGFKIEDGRSLNQVKSECIKFATELLEKLDIRSGNETVQHTF